MPDNTTCSHCGAPIEPNISVCPYCGSVVAATQSGPYGKWTAVSERMPPTDPNDPSRTIYVYADMCASVYYDFKIKKWYNDTYKETLKYKRFPEYKVDYWMPLPPETALEWVSVKDYIPEILVEGACSIFVLTCRKGTHYDSSLVMAQIDYIDCKEGVWTGIVNLDSDNYKDQVIDVTHWMPLPAGPPK